MRSVVEILALALSLISISAYCDETLTLTWLQPAGYSSTLYQSTNLNGSWSSFGEVNPPVQVTATNPVTFFYVSVAPTDQSNPVIMFVDDPNAENLKPAFTNKPAMAYNESAYFSFWSIENQRWN